VELQDSSKLSLNPWHYFSMSKFYKLSLNRIMETTWEVGTNYLLTMFQLQNDNFCWTSRRSPSRAKRQCRVIVLAKGRTKKYIDDVLDILTVHDERLLSRLPSYRMLRTCRTVLIVSAPDYKLDFTDSWAPKLGMAFITFSQTSLTDSGLYRLI